LKQSSADLMGASAMARFRLLTLLGVLLGLPLTARAVTATVAGAEYFFDSDPGEGNGLPLAAKDGAFDEAREDINTSGISTAGLKIGPHVLYLRMRDSDGHWSFTRAFHFRITGSVTITAAEYFIDTDPGDGLGSALAAKDGHFNSTVEAIATTGINTASLSVGNHTLFVRERDSEGRWGLARQYRFEASPLKSVSGAECFIGTPPTPGYGVPITPTPGPGSDEGQVSFSAQAQRLCRLAGDPDLTEGQYTVSVRMQDNYQKWGTPSAQNFVIVTPTPTLTPANTPTSTLTPTVTPTQTAAATPTATPTRTPTFTPTHTATWTPTATATPTRTPTPTPSATLTGTPTPSPTASPTGTLTNTSTPTATATGTPTYTPTPTATSSPTPTPTYTWTPTFTPTSTSTPTMTPTETPTASATPTPSSTDTPTTSPTETATDTPTFTETPTESPTASPTPTPSSTDTPSVPPTWTPSPSATPTPLPCRGDCDDSGDVTIDEILTLVNIALGNSPVADCLLGDANGDQQITVDEILRAVNNALNGCGGAAALNNNLRQSSNHSDPARAGQVGVLDESRCRPTVHLAIDGAAWPMSSLDGANAT
jgi:hypothetical protein